MTDQQYNSCVDQFADNVYRFIVKNLKHEEDARDIVQTAYEKMWRNRDAVDFHKSKSYLFTVAYNQMIDHIRKHKKITYTDTLNDSATVYHPQPTRSNAKQLLHEALEKLSEVQRSLVMLKDYEGYSYEQIGSITGLSESQVKVYLHRARLALRNYLVSAEHVF